VIIESINISRRTPFHLDAVEDLKWLQLRLEESVLRLRAERLV